MLIDAIDLEGSRCASILNGLLNMFPKKSPLALRAREMPGSAIIRRKKLKHEKSFLI